MVSCRMDPMKHFLLLYWVISFSVGFCSLGMSLIQWRRSRDPESKDHFFFLLALTFMILSLTVLYYCGFYLPGSVAYLIAGIFAYGATAHLSLALVDFTLSMVEDPLRVRIRWIWGGIAWAAAIPAGLSLFFPKVLQRGDLPVFVILGLSVAYITLSAVRGRPKRVIFSPVTGKVLTVASVICFPGHILVDIFHDWIPLVRDNIPKGFYFLPLFYLVWSLANLRDQLFYYNRAVPEEQIPAIWDLSPREKDVLALLLKGKTYGQIGESLFISLSTVKTHVERIYRKSETRGRMELINKVNRPTG